MQLTTDEVARRLGVRKATIYAYVSRGLLTSKRHGDGKESLFDEAEVTAFATRRGRSPVRDDVHTGLTLITGDALYYRGHDVRALAGTAPFESVVSLLWTGALSTAALTPDPGAPAPDLAAPATDAAALTPDPAVLAAVAALPPMAIRAPDRLRVIVAFGAAADPLRFDLTPAAVVATGRALLGTMVAGLPLRAPAPAGPSSAGPSPAGPSLAEHLWPRLTSRVPEPRDITALNAALVLLADHDLAASTYAARVAASTRADPWSVTAAGLATLSGPLHGGASALVHAMLTDALGPDGAPPASRDGASSASRDGDGNGNGNGADPSAIAGAVAAQLRLHGAVPGFGHPLYPGGDPRAAVLLSAAGIAEDSPLGRTIAGVIKAATGRSGTAPNIDFALAAFTVLHDMGADAGETIFAVARTAGWLAHALEEYADQPSRFRPTGRYAGRPPHPGSSAG